MKVFDLWALWKLDFIRDFAVFVQKLENAQGFHHVREALEASSKIFQTLSADRPRNLSGPYCALLQDYLSDTPCIPRYGVEGVSM